MASGDAEPGSELFVFGPFVVDAYARTVTARDHPVPLQPRTFELLEYLVRSPGRLLTKDEILEALWPAQAITDRNLSQQMFLLRTTLERHAPGMAFVQTEPGRGYRFVQHVSTRDVFKAPRDQASSRLYARGRYFFEKRTPDSLRRSIGFYERALQADPAFARAHAGLAGAYALLGEYLLAAPADAFPRARDAARTALALDAASADALVTLGDVACFYDRDFVAAEQYFARANALAPRASSSNVFRAWFLCVTGRAAAAVEVLDAAVTAEPYSLVLQTALGVASIFLREYGEAIEHLRAVLDMDADYVHARYYLAMALLLAGRHGDALDVCAGPLPDGYEQQLLTLRGAALAARGARGEAREALASIGALAARGRFVSSFNVASVNLALGEEAAALAALERGLTERDPWLIFVPEHPQFDPLRGDARFRALVERVRAG